MTYFKGQKENLPAMEDLGDLSQSSETASECGKLASPNYEAILKLIEGLSLECKGKSAVDRSAGALHTSARHPGALMRLGVAMPETCYTFKEKENQSYTISH